MQTERKTVFRVNQARCRVNKMVGSREQIQTDLDLLLVVVDPRFGA